MVELNKVYCMDNLELLKQMEDESIDLIYCDILYNTGKKFKDYDDKLGTPQQAIEWYKPRLIEMKRVLTDTGSIYLQCDYRLVHYLKVEMDSIFGINNFINEIIWCYSNPSQSKRSYSKKHDTILLYSKTKEYIFNQQFTDYKDGIHVNKTGMVKKYKGSISVSIASELELRGKPLEDWWIDIYGVDRVRKERVGYDTQKPKSLLERIVKASSNEGNIIADFFCGSGTTLVVAKELSRNYIGCDINPRAVEISNERLDNVKTK